MGFNSFKFSLMCGRYTLTESGADLWELIEGALPKPLSNGIDAQQVKIVLDAPNRRKFNIVPTSYEPILFSDKGHIHFQSAHWWLAPSWAGKQLRWRISGSGDKTFSWNGPPKSHFNSRFDTVTNPGISYWHGLLENQRCLIPANGFIEWADETLLKKGQEKIPKHFFLKEKKPFFFAGIFDKVEDDEGKPFLSFNILTVEPNEMLRSLPHHRMPGILTGNAVAKWIDSKSKVEDAAKLLRSTLDEDMDGFYISRLVNSPRNESSDVLEPLRQGNE